MIEGNISTKKATVVTNTPHVSANNQRFVATSAKTKVLPLGSEWYLTETKRATGPCSYVRQNQGKGMKKTGNKKVYGFSEREFAETISPNGP